MSATVESLGIIAGNRTLPFLIASEARKNGMQKIVAAAFEGETDPNLGAVVDDIVWLRVGQLSKLIRVFKERKISQCVMAGQIAPKNLFDVRPDLRAMMLLLKLKEKNAHSIFGGIALELEKEGIRLIEATPWLKAAMPSAGFHTGPRLSKQAREDAAFGYALAKDVSRLEIGQTVVVKEGTVLAVEGFEGTDRCLQRGGELAGKKGGAVAVKVTKHNHDMRFDIPCVGLQTVQICRDFGIEVLAIEREKTILLERNEVERLTLRGGPSIVTVPFEERQ
jgi:UDP-2,3-diacylglucosamine hydrolase